MNHSSNTSTLQTLVHDCSNRFQSDRRLVSLSSILFFNKDSPSLLKFILPFAFSWKCYSRFLTCLDGLKMETSFIASPKHFPLSHLINPTCIDSSRTLPLAKKRESAHILPSIKNKSLVYFYSSFIKNILMLYTSSTNYSISLL